MCDSIIKKLLLAPEDAEKGISNWIYGSDPFVLTTTEESGITNQQYMEVLRQEYPHSTFVLLPSSGSIMAYMHEQNKLLGYENYGQGNLVKCLGTKESLLELDSNFFDQEHKIAVQNKESIQKIIAQTLNLSGKEKFEYFFIEIKSKDDNNKLIRIYQVVISGLDFRIVDKFKKLSISLIIKDDFEVENLAETENIIEKVIMNPTMDTIELGNAIIEEKNKEKKSNNNNTSICLLM